MVFLKNVNFLSPAMSARLSVLARHLTSSGRSGLEYTVVDAFTSIPFAGNPAAVVLLEPGRTRCVVL